MLFRRLQIFRWMPLATWLACVFFGSLLVLGVVVGIGSVMFEVPRSSTVVLGQWVVLLLLPATIAFAEYRGARA